MNHQAATPLSKHFEILSLLGDGPEFGDATAEMKNQNQSATTEPTIAE